MPVVCARWSSQMLKAHRAELDYFPLVKRAKHLSREATVPRISIALIGDVSAQHLVPLLRALFASNGVDGENYEAGFDTIELESLRPTSGLCAFDPQVVIILQSIGKLKSSYYEFPDDRSKFVSTKAIQIEEVWKAIRTRSGAAIVQSTFVLPYERPFGNYGFAVADTLHGATGDL